MEEEYDIKPNVLDYDDIVKLVPRLKGHRKFVDWLLRFFSVDKVNGVHSRNCDTPGPEFVRRLIYDEFKLTLRIDNEEVLDRFPEGAFVTVSNHPFGALDGIMLIHLVASRRPQYRVMVNMVLNAISAMRPNFIAVDALASNDPKKKAISTQGIRKVIKQVRSGEPVGFFPAGAVSKINFRGELNDREWQPNVSRIIQQLKVPIIPIFFHGSNTWWFNLLGKISWQLRTLRLPAEVFLKNGQEMHISVGEPITVEEQMEHQGSVEEFAQFLKDKTYELRKCP